MSISCWDHRLSPCAASGIPERPGRASTFAPFLLLPAPMKVFSRAAILDHENALASSGSDTYFGGSRMSGAEDVCPEGPDLAGRSAETTVLIVDDHRTFA